MAARKMAIAASARIPPNHNVVVNMIINSPTKKGPPTASSCSSTCLTLHIGHSIRETEAKMSVVTMLLGLWLVLYQGYLCIDEVSQVGPKRASVPWESPPALKKQLHVRRSWLDSMSRAGQFSDCLSLTSNTIQPCDVAVDGPALMKKTTV
jgi:hypothetical protein